MIRCFGTRKLAKSSQSETKEKLRERNHLPIDLSLVDLAYDSKQNRFVLR